MVWIYVSPSTSSGIKRGYMHLNKIPFYLTSLDTPLSGVKGNPGSHPSRTPLSAWSSVSASGNTDLISLCFDYCVDVTRSPACRKPFISQTLSFLSSTPSSSPCQVLYPYSSETDISKIWRPISSASSWNTPFPS